MGNINENSDINLFLVRLSKKSKTKIEISHITNFFKIDNFFAIFPF